MFVNQFMQMLKQSSNQDRGHAQEALRIPLGEIKSTAGGEGWAAGIF